MNDRRWASRRQKPRRPTSVRTWRRDSAHPVAWEPLGWRNRPVRCPPTTPSHDVDRPDRLWAWRPGLVDPDCGNVGDDRLERLLRVRPGQITASAVEVRIEARILVVPSSTRSRLARWRRSSTRGARRCPAPRAAHRTTSSPRPEPRHERCHRPRPGLHELPKRFLNRDDHRHVRRHRRHTANWLASALARGLARGRPAERGHNAAPAES
jgi:hypothetical protein